MTLVGPLKAILKEVILRPFRQHQQPKCRQLYLNATNTSIENGILLLNADLFYATDRKLDTQ